MFGRYDQYAKNQCAAIKRIYYRDNAEHGIPVAHETMRWFYTFAADSFDEITYRFTPR